MKLLLRVGEEVDAPDDPALFSHAVRAWRARIPLTEQEYARLTAEEQGFAFKVAGVAQADLVTDVWQAIDAAVADGTTLEDFIATVGVELEAAWGFEDGARLETIFRTNVQSAYSDGRYEQLTDPTVLDARPYWRFDAVLDDRTTDICAPINGTVKAADDPWWDDHIPPLHFNCRSQFVALTEEEAADEGIDTQAPKADAPDDGFGDPPPDTGDGWTLDLEKYPEAIRDILKERLGR